MANNVVSAQFGMPSGPTRLVWILNKSERDYEETYKGSVIKVPANEKKTCLMPIIEARRFLAVPRPLYATDNSGKVSKPGKPLFTQELTGEERMTHDKRNSEELSFHEKELQRRQETMGKNSGGRLVEE